MKTIKLIELYNKIANDELEDETKFKYSDDYFKYYRHIKQFDRYTDDTYNTVEYYNDDLFNIEDLNDEVEIIEDTPKEDKKMAKMDFFYEVYDEKQNANNERFRDFINEIIDNQKEYVNGNYLYKDKKGLFGSSVGDIRYYYNYTPKYFMGTIFVNMKNKTISSYNNSKTIRINNGDIKTTIENKKKEELYTNIIFWVVWILLIGAAIFGFVYLENDYLED